MSNQAEHFLQGFMQSLPNKFVSKAIILIFLLLLILIPVVAIYKSSSLSSKEDETILPEIIEQEEVIEEVEYVYLPTTTPIPDLNNEITNTINSTPIPIQNPSMKDNDEYEDED